MEEYAPIPAIELYRAACNANFISLFRRMACEQLAPLRL